MLFGTLLDPHLSPHPLSPPPHYQFHTVVHTFPLRLRLFPLLDHERLLCQEAVAVAQALCPPASTLCEQPPPPPLPVNGRIGKKAAAAAAAKKRKQQPVGGEAEGVGEEGQVASWALLGGRRDVSSLIARAHRVAQLRQQQQQERLPASAAAAPPSSLAGGAAALRQYAVSVSGGRAPPSSDPELDLLRIFCGLIRSQHLACLALQAAGAAPAEAMPSGDDSTVCTACSTACHLTYTEDAEEESDSGGEGQQDGDACGAASVGHGRRWKCRAWKCGGQWRPFGEVTW